MELEKGFNPFNKVKFGSWCDNEKNEPYIRVRASYSDYDYYENNLIEEVYFQNIQDAYKWIHEDKKTCKELGEPPIKHIIEVNNFDKKDDCYYYDEYEVHYHRTGKIFLKQI